MIDRTTSGTGAVKSFTLKELQSFDAAFYFSPNKQYNNQKDKSVYSSVKNPAKTFPLRGDGITIPTLKKVFEMFLRKRMIIEIKQKKPSITISFCKLIREYNKEKGVIVGSFHQETLYEFRKTCPDVTTSAGPMEVIGFLLLQKIHLSKTLSPVATALQVPEKQVIPFAGFRPVIRVVNESFIKTAHKKNMSVQVWTINEKEQMKRLISLGVDGIMTDYPDRLIAIML